MSRDEDGGSHWLGWVGLAIALFLAYLPALNGEFLWDDIDIYIVNNSLLRAGDGLWRFWFTNEPFDYYPLTYSTFWFEWRLAGLHPTLYHVDNLICHALTCVMLYRLLERLAVPWRFLIVCGFALHPVQVESVAWICQRKTVLAALFGFAAATDYLDFRTSGRRWLQLRAVLWFVLSLSAKPTMITLPVLFFLGEYAARSRSWTTILRSTAPFFAASLVFGLVGLAYQQKLIGGVDVRNQDLTARLASFGWATWFYIVQSIPLWSPTFVYPRWQVDGYSVIAWIPNVLLVAMVLGIRQLPAGMRNRVTAAFGAFMLTMFPSLGLADVFFWRYSYVGDHYVYQSLPALLVLWVYLLQSVAERFRLPRFGLYATCWGVIGVWLIMSMVRSADYQSEARIWTDTLTKNPNSALALSNLGILKHRAGDTDEGKRLLADAVLKDPRSFETRVNLAEIHRAEQQWSAARDEYQAALEIAPAGSDFYRTALGRVGAAEFQLGDVTAARRSLERGIRLLSVVDAHSASPRWLGLRCYQYVYLARLDELQGTTGEARIFSENVMQRAETSPESWREIAAAYEELGVDAEALHWLQRLSQQKPDDVQLMTDVGRVALRTGDVDLALESLTQALEKQPNNLSAQTNLGIALMSAGRTSEAIAVFQRAVTAHPQDYQVQSNLALACAMAGEHRKAIAAFRHAHELAPESVETTRDLAWILATSAESTTEERQESLALSRSACEVTQWQDPRMLDAFAAALAANARWDEAVSTQETALSKLTELAGPPEQQQAYRERLDRYSRHEPFRE